MWRSQNGLYLVSGPARYHPQTLSEPDLNLSIHPAPIIQPNRISPLSSVQIDEALCDQELVRRWMVARFQIRMVANCKKKKEDLFLKGDEVSSLLILKKRASRFWIKFRYAMWRFRNNQRYHSRHDFSVASHVIPNLFRDLWRQLQRMNI